MTVISIVTSENIGEFEWRTDPLEAEGQFRQMRGTRGVTKLWHGIDVGDLRGEEITDYVDSIYWGWAPGIPADDDGQAAQEKAWGTPSKVHRPLGSMTTREAARNER